MSPTVVTVDPSHRRIDEARDPLLTASTTAYSCPGGLIRP